MPLIRNKGSQLQGRNELVKGYYTFQCNRCFIISGYASTSLGDAPICCSGESMRPIYHEFSKLVGVENEIST